MTIMLKQLFWNKKNTKNENKETENFNREI